MALTKLLTHFYFEATFLFEYIFVYLSILKSLLLLYDLAVDDVESGGKIFKSGTFRITEAVDGEDTGCGIHPR